MTCNHEIGFLEGIDPDVFIAWKWNAAVEALYYGDLIAGALVSNAIYCSICPSVAEYRCIKRFIDKDAQPLTNGEESIGCGMFLCQNCKDLKEQIEESKYLSDIWEDTPINVLDRLVSVANRSPNYDGIRADASFLTSNGELMRRMDEGMGLSEEEKSKVKKERMNNEGDEDKVEEKVTNKIEERIERIYDRIGKASGMWMEKGKGKEIKFPLREEIAGVGAKNWKDGPASKTKSESAPGMNEKSAPALRNIRGNGGGSSSGSRNEYAERTGKSAASQQTFGAEESMDFLGHSIGSTKRTARKRETC